MEGKLENCSNFRAVIESEHSWKMNERFHQRIIFFLISKELLNIVKTTKLVFCDKSAIEGNQKAKHNRRKISKKFHMPWKNFKIDNICFRPIVRRN